jgi:tetratricopeptide (TPR) repeat protein
MTTQQILERLDQRLPLLTGGARDLPERQRTLRATIEWSYELLDASEQQLFTRLGVFRGGCTLEAAEAVAGADLDTLQSLVDKSLLRHSGDRYWMLETIREFAAERMDDNVPERHAEYFLARAEGAEPHLRADDPEWVSRLAADLDNVRAALDRLEQTGQTQAVMRFLGAAARLWYLRSLWRESLQRLESALAADERPTTARAKVLRAAGAMAVVNGDFETARHHIEQSLELNAAIGDPQGLAYSRFLLGFAAAEEGDFARARAPLEQSLHEFRTLGDDHLEGIVAYNLAWAYDELGEFELARELNEENLRRAERSDDDRIRSFTLTNLASDAAHRRD